VGRARDSLDRVGSAGKIERTITAAVRIQAKKAGADDILLSRANASTLPLLRSRLAVYRLLSRVGTGDLDHLPHLFEKLGTDLTSTERWSVYRLAGVPVDEITADSSPEEVVEILGPTIRAELAATGESTLLEWLITEQQVELDDSGFRRLIEYRCELALLDRLGLETTRSAVDVPLQARALRALASTHDRASDLFAAGSTLLTLHEGNDLFSERVLEFGTTADLSTVEVDLWARGAVTLRRRGDHLRVRHLDTGVTANVFRFHVHEGLFCHGKATYTRWHTRFELGVLERNGERYRVPADVERYLDERFGQWRTPTLFYDRVFNAPNTTSDETLESLLYLYRRTTRAFSKGSRFYADRGAERLRDVFGIDYSMYVPQALHSKVLSLPFDAHDAAGREIVVLADAFTTIGADDISSFERANDAARYLVAAVHDDGHPEVNDRLARVKSLRSVDHVALFSSASELRDTCAAIGARTVLLRPESAPPIGLDALEVGEESAHDITVEYLAPTGDRDVQAPAAVDPAHAPVSGQR